MAKFMFIYHGGSTPESKEAQDASMAAWGVFMQTHADAIADGGAPVGKSKTVGANGVEDHGGPNPTFGYSIFEAASIDDACAIAADCPIVAEGGSVEVAPVVEL